MAAAPHLDPNQRNRYRALREFALGAERVASLPASLQIAQNNRCNFKCVYCPDHRRGNEVPRSELSESEWSALLELIPTSLTMAFHGISEFMIDPQFFAIVERCASSRVHLSLNTNGSVCTPRHLDALRAYPAPLYVNFSVDAATPETYRRIRGWDFERLLRNVRRYVECFAGREHHTWTTLSYVITASNVHEVPAAVDLASRLGVDGIKFYRLNEDAWLDWRVPADHGGDFDYRAERTSLCQERHDAAVREAARLGRAHDLVVELPAPYGLSAEAPR